MIAIVDDDITFRFVFSIQLKSLNNSNQIIEFDDGNGLLDYLQKHKETPQLLPHTIFLDLNMKKIDGWAFLEKFEILKNSLEKKINIHILSSSDEEEDRTKALESQFVNSFFIKPIENETLKDVLGYP